jgi:hypothetical protein
MLKRTFLNKCQYFRNDINFLFDHRLPQQNPQNISNKLSSQDYLKSCQDYISPLTKNNLVHQLILYKYYCSKKDYKHIYHDIAIKIATRDNIIYKNPDGYTPIHLALEIEDYRFLHDVLDIKPSIITKQPYDDVLEYILRHDPNPVDGVYDFFADKFFIKK